MFLGTGFASETDLFPAGPILACKQTLGEIPSAVKHQNWDSAPLHKLIKNFPLFARPLA
jgi:hypothetical protein